MRINLNDPKAFTIKNIRRLIASVDDSTHTQLRVNKEGIAYLSKPPLIGNVGIDNLAFCFGTWIAGNGYVGTEASKDDSWVNNVFNMLKENWPNPKDTFIDWKSDV